MGNFLKNILNFFERLLSGGQPAIDPKRQTFNEIIEVSGVKSDDENINDAMFDTYKTMSRMAAYHGNVIENTPLSHSEMSELVSETNIKSFSHLKGVKNFIKKVVLPMSEHDPNSLSDWKNKAKDWLKKLLDKAGGVKKIDQIVQQPAQDIEAMPHPAPDPVPPPDPVPVGEADHPFQIGEADVEIDIPPPLPPQHIGEPDHPIVEGEADHVLEDEEDQEIVLEGTQTTLAGRQAIEDIPIPPPPPPPNEGKNEQEGNEPKPEHIAQQQTPKGLNVTPGG